MGPKSGSDVPDCCRLKETGLHKCCAGAHFHVEARHPGKEPKNSQRHFQFRGSKWSFFVRFYCTFPEPVFKMASRANARIKSYKNKALDSQEMRRRREEEGIQLRKTKREEQVSDVQNSKLTACMVHDIFIDSVFIW